MSADTRVCMRERERERERERDHMQNYSLIYLITDADCQNINPKRNCYLAYSRCPPIQGYVWDR